MIVLFTDFGSCDPYVGQVHAVLAREAPDVTVIDLLHAVPNYDIRAAAYLLPAYVDGFPSGSVFLGVVDPGVGGSRRPVMVNASDRWFVGPDNGIFEILARRAAEVNCYEIRWRPRQLSASFHGRDLFAPVAAMLAVKNTPAHSRCSLTPPSGPRWPDDLPQIVYVDHYGNAVTGIRTSQLEGKRRLEIKGRSLEYARTFNAAPPGRAFWYGNANGLVEISVNRGNAADVLGLEVGDEIAIKE